MDGFANALGRLSGLLFWLIFVVATFYPEKLWGIHSISFLSICSKTILLFIGLILIVPSHFLTVAIQKISNSIGHRPHLIYAIYAGFLVSFVVSILQFQIVWDEYGNAFQYQDFLDQTVNGIPSQVWDDLFNLSIQPSTGRKTILNLYTVISHFSGVSYAVIFQWAGLLAGVGFVLTWIVYVHRTVRRLVWRMALTTIGCFAPMTLVFYNHAEIYAPVYFFLTVWILILAMQVRSKNSVVLWLLLILTFINIKLHPLNIILVFPWIMALFNQYAWPYMNRKSVLTWKHIIYGLYLPVFVAGAVVYFFVLGDYNDPRFLDGVTDAERLFLPILSPAPPLDRYDLFSWNHILDFLNVLFLWSIPGLFIGVTVFHKYRKQLNFSDPVFLILFNTLLLFGFGLFMVNPLLSMPMDWDLFVFPSILVLSCVALLVGQSENYPHSISIVPPVIGLQLMIMPWFIINADAEMLSHRLESVGRHIYKTYYLHSSRILISSLGISREREEYILRKQAILQDLKPWSRPGDDPKYANLLMDDGYYFMTIEEDYDRAVTRFEEASSYFPKSEVISELLIEAQSRSTIDYNEKVALETLNLDKGIRFLRVDKDYSNARKYFEKVLAIHPESPKATLFLLEACFQLKDYYAAYLNATKLVQFEHPNAGASLRISIHCALEAGLEKEAKDHCGSYLKLFPDDTVIIEVEAGLHSGKPTTELAKLFKER